MHSTIQRGALIFGIAFLLIGLLGLLVPGGTGMDANPETAGRLFGLFPVNLLHNLVHLAFGVWGILAARAFDAARVFGKVGAVVYGLLVVLAFIDPTTFGLVPIGSHDIWLHAILAVGLAYIGWAPAHAEGGVAA